MREYVEACEGIYDEWLRGEPLVPDEFRSDFDMAFAPEPYLTFDGGKLTSTEPSLVFLTTNPGGGEPFQMTEPCGIAREGRYVEFQARLVDCYYTAPGSIGAAASTRINRMRGIRDALGKADSVIAPGFIQCEAIPFHSGKLPKPRKQRLSMELTRGEQTLRLRQYTDALRGFLSVNHVIALDASNEPGDPWNDWTRFKAGLLGLATNAQAVSVGAPSNRGRHSSFIHVGPKDGVLIRAHYFRQGQNNFRNHPEAVVDAIRAVWSKPTDRLV